MMRTKATLRGRFLAMLAVPALLDYGGGLAEGAPVPKARLVTPPVAKAPAGEGEWAALTCKAGPQTPAHLLSELEQVPEVMLNNSPSRDSARIIEFNKIKADHFLDVLASHRPDLAGLPFLKGDACRLDMSRRTALDRAMLPVRKGLMDRGTFWKEYRWDILNAEKEADEKEAGWARVRALAQTLAPESLPLRQGLVEELSRLPEAEATRFLARLAIFSQDEVRLFALAALSRRPYRQIVEVFVQGVRYPWPAIAERTAEAVVQLQRAKPVVAAELMPHFIALLEEPDPRDPVVHEVGKEKKPVVRELVRLNHTRNCLLCHPPLALAERAAWPRDELGRLLLVGAVPEPGERSPSGPGYSSSGNLARGDVTYLRQDFSLMQPVMGLGLESSGLERFDYLVRSRVLSDSEAEEYHDIIRKRGPAYESPYRRAALRALREWSGQDVGADPAAWRKLLGIEK